jgi:hypothetical protein
MFFKGGQGMSIITREEIEDLFETLHPKLDLSTIITVNDEELTKVLHCFLFLKQYEQDIVDHSSFTYEVVLYSQYYWFVYFKNHYVLIYGYDGGLEDQANLLVENLTNELAGEVNWELLKKIDNP